SPASASRSSPPVEMISTPKPARPFAKSRRPVLSETEMRARAIFIGERNFHHQGTKERKECRCFVPLNSLVSRCLGGFQSVSCRGGGFFVLELDLVEATVEATLVEEFAVGADLGDAAVVHHDDLVGLENGGKPVRD